MHFRPNLFLALALFCLAPVASLADDPGPVDFRRDIWPILRDRCVDCHGSDQQEGGLRLDQLDKALLGGESGAPAIVPQRSTQSELVRRISAADESIRMPADAPPLSATQIESLRRWIDQGAEWPADAVAQPTAKPTHWSFQPVARPRIPQASSAWVANPIDAFIWQSLSANGLSPSRPATPQQFIRRAYLDLLGLLPVPEQVDAFGAAQGPDTPERLIDELLANPHYGQRWARHWLDVVRFGESDGFETNPERPNAWHYRDYVIEAFNRDKPYDQFIVEQLAGDSLGVDVATGYLVGGPFDRVKSPDISLTQMQRQNELDDMINTTGTAVCALTLGCARCHNHKFDPVSQADYYSVQAIFAGVQHGERTLRVPQPMVPRERWSRAVEQQQIHFHEIVQWMGEANQRARSGVTSLAPPVNPYLNVDDFSPVVARWVRLSIDATNGGSEPCLDELEIYAATPDGAVQWQNLAAASAGAQASASGTLAGFNIHKLEHVHDGRVGNGRSWISDIPNRGWVTIELKKPAPIARVVWGRDRQLAYRDRLAIEYRIETALEPNDWRLVAGSQGRRPYAGEADAAASLKHVAPELGERVREHMSAASALAQQLREWEGGEPVAYVGKFQQPGPVHRLYRGDPASPREARVPNTIELFGQLDLSADTPEPVRRMSFARSLVEPTNPLTARVIVNRLWHYHFGQGLVGTPSDFGINGDRPSHPELLDWLAAELIDHGWSLKHIQRLILTSNTYRQSSAPQENGLRVDAGCRLLWRFPLRRLEAEAMRDCALQASGSLNWNAGGKGFLMFDVIPETVHHYFPKKVLAPGDYRRTIYMTKIRQEQDSVFGLFDCPDGGQVTPRRSRSTTPLQALGLFNSPFTLELAERFASRIQRDAGEDIDRQTTRAFRLLFARAPCAAELEESRPFIRDHGLAAFCRALLNSNEFLFLN